eukprot:TRINITY_DN5146_c0_g2_i1.p6 TRINITY_DN5146_c0_g2~~TRINITY_DN5146_c0_g2_i1.p6  ORF type:complete len:234 (+),score=-15.01 TRINITY_DN5146_c0_g2_i1:921-1622(+)
MAIEIVSYFFGRREVYCIVPYRNVIVKIVTTVIFAQLSSSLIYGYGMLKFYLNSMGICTFTQHTACQYYFRAYLLNSNSRTTYNLQLFQPLYIFFITLKMCQYQFNLPQTLLTYPYLNIDSTGVSGQLLGSYEQYFLYRANLPQRERIFIFSITQKFFVPYYVRCVYLCSNVYSQMSKWGGEEGVSFSVSNLRNCFNSVATIFTSMLKCRLRQNFVMLLHMSIHNLDMYAHFK